MNNLVVLAEDGSDELFYETIAERVSGLSFHLHDPRRIRRNGGIGAVRKVMKAFLNDLKAVASSGDTYFIIALDNDRAPTHPEHERLPGLNNADNRKVCRVCEIADAVANVFGQNQSSWPAKGAFAVPVEMLESWALLSLDPTLAPLPLFSRKTSSSARTYYNGHPPDQLKDLLRTHRGDISSNEFLLQTAGLTDLAGLSAASPSFEHFREQLKTWVTL